jgi:hypothetical protein
MVQVCERNISQQQMLDQSLSQYKEMYRVVIENWGTVVQVTLLSLLLTIINHTMVSRAYDTI